jgi:hypothetical protein
MKGVSGAVVVKPQIGQFPRFYVQSFFIISSRCETFAVYTDFLNTRAEFFFLWLCSPIQPLAASIKFSLSLRLLDLGQSVGLHGGMISSSQGLCLYANTKHSCPEWNSNPRSRRPREQRHFVPQDRSATVTGLVQN